MHSLYKRALALIILCCHELFLMSGLLAAARLLSTAFPFLPLLTKLFPRLEKAAAECSTQAYCTK